jgi:hypothetical protein
MVEDLETTLRDELKRLGRMLGLPHHLTVRWVPSETSSLAGEVKGDCILIYTVDDTEALTVLRHEVIDYCISQAIKPYQELTNRLIALLNDHAYHTKEAIVEALTRFVS